MAYDALRLAAAGPIGRTTAAAFGARPTATPRAVLTFTWFLCSIGQVGDSPHSRRNGQTWVPPPPPHLTPPTHLHPHTHTHTHHTHTPPHTHTHPHTPPHTTCSTSCWILVCQLLPWCLPWFRQLWPTLTLPFDHSLADVRYGSRGSVAWRPPPAHYRHSA